MVNPRRVWNSEGIVEIWTTIIKYDDDKTNVEREENAK